MNRSAYSLCLIIFLLTTAVQPHAQNPGGGDPGWANPLEVGVPSPTAATIGNAALSDVAHESGALSLSIPLFEIPTRSGMTIPITLSYQSNGVKVDDVAGWVGMGWTLHAGGAVTRSVRGLPDEHQNGYPVQGQADASALLNSQMGPWSAVPPTPSNGVLQRLWRGEADTQPDLFSFSMPGHSGRFIWASQNEIVPIPYQPIMITGNQTGWQFTASDGSRYIFEETGGFGGTEQSTNFGPPDQGASMVPSAWMLAKIIPPTGSESNDFVGFRYTYPNSTTLIRPQWEEHQAGCGGEPADGIPMTSSHQTDINEVYLTEIETDDHLLRFHIESRASPMDESQHFTWSDGQHKLVRLDIFNKVDNNEILIKQFHFDYEYRQSNSPGIIADESNRLFLTSVTEHDANEEPLPPYIFTYDDTVPLPARTSGHQDHWGYPGGTSSTTLLPVGSNPNMRTPQIGGGKYGVLTTITYPAGGYEIIEWEDNYGQMYSGVQLTGGMRVKRRSVFAEPGTGVVHRYEYGASYAVDPVYQTSYGGCTITSAHSLATLGEGSGTWYNEVTVFQEDDQGNDISGKTVHHYHFVPDYPDEGGMIAGAATNWGWQARPLGVMVFNHDGEMVRGTSSEYDLSNEWSGHYDSFPAIAVRMHMADETPVVMYYSKYHVISGVRRLANQTDITIGESH